MKKIITICFLSIIMLTGAVQSGKSNNLNANPAAAAAYSVWIKITINFHRPKMQCQSGFGICLDFEAGLSKPYGAGLCPVQARINAAGQLELSVTQDDLLKYENGFALPYFKSETLAIEDPYTFSDAVTKQLGSDRRITVKPGSYPVEFDATARTYTVKFTL